MKENNLTQIINNIKKIITNLQLVDGKVFDNHVANLLNIPHNTLANQKKRNSIPYKELLKFCVVYGIDIKSLFYGEEF